MLSEQIIDRKIKGNAFSRVRIYTYILLVLSAVSLFIFHDTDKRFLIVVLVNKCYVKIIILIKVVIYNDVDSESTKFSNLYLILVMSHYKFC